MQHIEGFAGRQVRPEDPGYDEARAVFNAMVDRRPALIAECTSEVDVAAAVRFARSGGLPLAVRSGGHSVAGYSMVDDGVVLDLRGMNAVHVDPDLRIARVQAGAVWGEVDAITQEHGLATTGGRVSTTGVGGFTLGGGSGWIERSCGLAVDNLVAARMITAEGDLVTCNGAHEPDLLWALRGGGGNFGVVTEMELLLHPVGPEVYGGLAAFDPRHARTMARAFRDFYATAPDAAGIAMGYVFGPPEEFIPRAWQGERMFAIVGCWNGPVDEGAKGLAPLLATAPPVVDLFGPIPYVQLQCMIDDPPGLRHWWTGDYVDALPDAALEAFCRFGEDMPGPMSQLLVAPWGGAVARAGDETPLAKREAAFIMHPFAMWDDPARDAEHVAWGRRSHEVFAPWTTGGVYLNFVGDEGEERVRAAFGPAYDRLAEIKARFDPDNVFRGNQNIKPRRREEAAAR